MSNQVDDVLKPIVAHARRIVAEPEDGGWQPPVVGSAATYGGGLRSDPTGKGRYDLLPRAAIHAYAKRLEDGAKAHGDRNWEKCGTPEGLARFMESALRHLFQASAGFQDEDHLAAVLFNVGALIHFRDTATIAPLGEVGPRVGG